MEKTIIQKSKSIKEYLKMIEFNIVIFLIDHLGPNLKTSCQAKLTFQKLKVLQFCLLDQNQNHNYHNQPHNHSHNQFGSFLFTKQSHDYINIGREQSSSPYSQGTKKSQYFSNKLYFIMTQRTRRISVIEDPDGQHYIDIPVQFHRVSREPTYFSGDLEHQDRLERQIQHWKAEYEHAQSHLEKFEEILKKYNKTLAQKAQLERKCKENQFEIQNLQYQILTKTDSHKDQERKKKYQEEHLMKKHLRQIEKYQRDIEQLRQDKQMLENELEDSNQSKNSLQKKRREYQKQMDIVKSQLNAEVQSSRESLENCRIQNASLKKKLHEAIVEKQIPLQTIIDLKQQVQSLNTKLRNTEDQLMRSIQNAQTYLVDKKIKEEEYIILKREFQKEKMHNQTQLQKFLFQIDSLTRIQSEVIAYQRQNQKLKDIIQNKNQQITLLLQKVQTIENPILKSHRENKLQQYLNQIKTLQKQLQQKSKQHIRELDSLEAKMKRIQQEADVDSHQKTKIISENQTIINLLKKDYNQLKEAHAILFYKREENKSQNSEIKTIFQKKMQESQKELRQMKYLVLQFQEKIRLLQSQKQHFESENRTMQDRYSKTIFKLKHQMNSIKQNQNQKNNINKAELQQLYQAKLSSKDELIQLLRLKLRNYDAGGLEYMYKTGTSTYC